MKPEFKALEDQIKQALTSQAKVLVYRPAELTAGQALAGVLAITASRTGIEVIVHETAKAKRLSCLLVTHRCAFSVKPAASIPEAFIFASSADSDEELNEFAARIARHLDYHQRQFASRPLK